MDRSRRNVLLLALCQAAFISTASLMATIGTLAGHVLAADKALATLPATALTVGTALGTIPASLIMRRVGRGLDLRVSRADEGPGGERFPDLADGGGDLALVRAAAAPAWLDGDPRDGRPLLGLAAAGLLAASISARAGFPPPRDA